MENKLNGFDVKIVNELLKQSGVKRWYLADVLNMSQPTLRSRLDGRSDFTAPEIVKLANFFRVLPAVFFTSKFPENENTVSK